MKWNKWMAVFLAGFATAPSSRFNSLLVKKTKKGEVSHINISNK
jgi:hypothetical protein